MARPPSPEFDALLALVDPWLFDHDGMVRERLRTLPAIDWTGVIDLAARHRILPLLAGRIEAALGGGDPRAEPPADCLSRLRHEARRAVAAELGMLGELRRIKAGFDADGIRMVLFKGLALSSRCYGKLGLRFNRDIDLLVAPEDFARAHAALTAAGYRRVEPDAQAPAAQVERSLTRGKDWVYVRDEPNFIVELHHRLLDNPHLCDPEMITRARPITLFGQLEVLTLAEEDELAYLALHGAMHAWSRLKWLLDVAVLIRDQPPGELARILQANRAAPASCALHQAVSLCWQLFRPDRPQPVDGRPWRTRPLSAVAMRSLAGHGARELEDTRFGTTLKNLSHYLLYGRLSYLVAEFRFDFADTSRDGPNASRLPWWLARPVAWFARHA